MIVEYSIKEKLWSKSYVNFNQSKKFIRKIVEWYTFNTTKTTAIFQKQTHLQNKLKFCIYFQTLAYF